MARQPTIAIRLCQRSKPLANSLQTNTLGEFAGTAYSLPLATIKKYEKWDITMLCKSVKMDI